MAQPKASTAPVDTASALPKASAASAPEAMELSEAARSITLVRRLSIIASIVLTMYPYVQPPPIVPLVAGVFNDPPPSSPIPTYRPIHYGTYLCQFVRHGGRKVQRSGL